MVITVNTIRNVVYLQVPMNCYADAPTEMDGMVDMLKFKEKNTAKNCCLEVKKGSKLR